MKIGIYSGSFNPVHNGHISLVDYIISKNYVDEVWMIRTPLNPLKKSNSLLDNQERQTMLELAIEGHKGLRICTIEDSLPQPNYTINTLQALADKYPDNEFHLIIGADNWEIFNHWHEWEKILDDFNLIIYPRPGYDYPLVDNIKFPKVKVVDAPTFDISSTEIRELIKNENSFSSLVPNSVADYINKNCLYK